MNAIKHYLVIKAIPEIVYKAITDQNGLSSWWTENTIGNSAIGSTIDFIFGDLYHDRMLISNLKENRRVEWECIKGDPEWVETKFTFELEPKKEDTILRFSHYNWKAETDFFANCNYHWGYYLRSLKLYCESGVGTPFSQNK